MFSFALVGVFGFFVNTVSAGINDTPRWVIADNGNLYYSDDDGANWTAAADQPYSGVLAIAQNGTMWLAGSQTGGDLMYSYDGSTWVGLGYLMGESGTRWINAIAWNGSRWVASGSPSAGVARSVIYSDDGLTWSDPIVPPNGGDFHGVASNGSRFVLTGTRTYYSDDAITWTESSNNLFSGVGDFALGVAYNGSRWVIAGKGTANDFAYSDDDGVTWVGAGNLSHSSYRNFSVAWNGNRFVTATNDDTGSTYYSDDGITWTAGGDSFGNFGYGYSIAWNGTMFMAGGQYGTNTLITSTDGITWAGLGNTFTTVRAIASAPAPNLYPAQLGDSTAPSVSNLSPLDNATEVSLDTNLVITFDEAVDVETGNIFIKKSSDNSTVETIDVTSGLVTGTGTTIITINPTNDLNYSTEYYVNIGATAFDDAAGNSYAGISDATTWSFTTPSAPVTLSSGSRPQNTSVVASVVNATQVTCPQGYLYDVTTGIKCTSWTAVQAPSPAFYNFGTLLIKMDTKGEECKAWQMYLNDKFSAGLVVDGWCGKLTMAVAKAWQASVGLVADGLLGSLSRAKALGM